MFGPKPPGTGVLNGFLDRGCSVTGELHFDDTLRLDGIFRGKIVSKHALIIGDSAEFHGEIEVGSVSINGRVEGSIRALERIELHPSARVKATLIAPVLLVEEGAVLEGEVSMCPARVADAAPPPEEERKVVPLSGGKRREEERRERSAG
jgi:cytoskeletal protein CcmA (bactofilin family)